MKTKTKLLLGLSIIAALCIGFLAGILLNFPPVDDSAAAGTFGKAEKFRKVQMTENDIQLRSELVKDTVQLRKMIQDLAYFTLFTNDLSATLDMTVLTFRDHTLGENQASASHLYVLQDYSGFIRNNNQNMNSLIAMLTDLLNNPGNDKIGDVEKNLRDFGSYVERLGDLNGRLNDALVSLDASILESKKLRENQVEFKKVKSIRDQLLIKGIQMGSLVGSKEQVSRLITLTLSSQNQFSAVSGKEELTALNVKEGIQALEGQNEVNSVVTSQELSSNSSNQFSDSKALFVYNSKDLSFSYSRDENLGRSVDSQDLSRIAGISANGINVCCSQYGISNIVNSNAINSSLTRELTGVGVFNMEDANNAIGSQIGSVDLGRITSFRIDASLTSRQ